MKLLDTDVRRFQRLYKKHFGEEVDNKEAREQLTRLVRQVEIVYQPITIAQFESYLKKYVKEGGGSE